jgi:hypothetical protein
MADMDMAVEMAETDDVAAGVAALDWCGADAASPADVALMWQQSAYMVGDVAGVD